MTAIGAACLTNRDKPLTLTKIYLALIAPVHRASIALCSPTKDDFSKPLISIRGVHNENSEHHRPFGNHFWHSIAAGGITTHFQRREFVQARICATHNPA